MFPGRWPKNFEPMWNPGWSTPSATPDQTFVPQGQFCGDPNYQQSQAQTQSHINALQQHNALLNQQLYNQSMSHINHLQQLIPHQQAHQPSTIPTPPIHQTPPAPTPSQPEPPTLTVTTPSPPPILHQPSTLKR